MELFIQIIILVFGFVLLVKGADFFVDGAAGIAARFGIPQLIIGLTIVAMGTSAPETAVSITAAFKGNADISIGNVVGSNIMNVLVILGLASVIVSIRVAKSTVYYEIPFMILITVVLLVLGLDGTVGRVDGMILWALFLLYLTYLLIMAKRNKEDEEETKDISILKALLYTVGGAVMIILGSDFAVESAGTIAKMFGMSDRLIGLTIIALGTSLPELVTSVSAARKGNADIAIGNIVGSNVFNILFVIGTSALIIPIHFASNFRMDAVIATGAAILLLLCSIKNKKLDRFAGILMLMGYAGYFAYLLYSKMVWSV